jgi:hypothetical protein
MDRAQLLRRIDRPWRDFEEAFAGLSNEDMLRPGVAGDWSVKDVIAHVRTWDGETLRALPLIVEGKRPPRYGGIDAFNARQAESWQGLTPAVARRQLAETHQELLAYLARVPEQWFATETRFRRRLRLDTYSHYPEHTEAILAWRKASGL